MGEAGTALATPFFFGAIGLGDLFYDSDFFLENKVTKKIL